MLRLARDRKTDALRLTFALPADAVTGKVSVVGDFNNWTPCTHVLRRRSNGTVSAAVTVRPGSTLRFRYLGEHGHWFDDPDADHIDEHGSVVTVRA
ncbi:isoamylase early set domain-containing protein [Raineyella sp.]|uniref:isoamylase early set domain-containing protein n=1 Tax=Raineyella sp. TaxID=1911550 RepID=UPI002B212110|nr:isoamylase early set domain-containing protein [Raineyella sp.]MEA5153599.1 isoamylase early set domain-containing protein [Raineyella sp.]